VGKAAGVVDLQRRQRLFLMAESLFGPVESDPMESCISAMHTQVQGTKGSEDEMDLSLLCGVSLFSFKILK